MLIILGLIAISLVIAVSFLLIFLWNMKTGQYDDTYSPSVRMLFEDTRRVNGAGDHKNRRQHDTKRVIKKV